MEMHSSGSTLASEPALGRLEGSAVEQRSRSSSVLQLPGTEEQATAWQRATSPLFNSLSPPSNARPEASAIVASAALPIRLAGGASVSSGSEVSMRGSGYGLAEEGVASHTIQQQRKTDTNWRKLKDQIMRRRTSQRGRAANGGDEENEGPEQEDPVPREIADADVPRFSDDESDDDDDTLQQLRIDLDEKVYVCWGRGGGYTVQVGSPTAKCSPPRSLPVVLQGTPAGAA
jgi:hypothetical protein